MRTLRELHEQHEALKREVEELKRQWESERAPIRLSVNLTPESAEALRKLSEDRGPSIADVVRDNKTGLPS